MALIAAFEDERHRYTPDDEGRLRMQAFLWDGLVSFHEMVRALRRGKRLPPPAAPGYLRLVEPPGEE